MAISGKDGTLVVSLKDLSPYTQLTMPEHYLDLIDIAIVDETQNRARASGRLSCDFEVSKLVKIENT